MKCIFEKDMHLGIIKGGQLGRMLLQPCMNFGVVPHVMDSDPEAPSRDYCTHFTVGDAMSFDDVYAFGKDLDVLTLEFEHVNLQALSKLSDEGVKVYPSPELIEIVQDKGKQKLFYQKHNITSSAFELVDNKKQLKEILAKRAVVQKKRAEGYDGRGVVVLKTLEDFDKGFDEPSVVEDKINIAKELSVLVARNASGEVKTYPTVEMVFHSTANMLDFLFAPAGVSRDQEKEIIKIGTNLAEKLDLVGLLAVELFLTEEGTILVNEIAPRPHNSGHHTIEANMTSQFEQHIRAVFNLPLGSTELISPAAMVNVVGDTKYEGPAVLTGIQPFLKIPGIYIHWYGKKITRPFRKMGHITVMNQNLQNVLETAKKIKQEVKVISC